MEVVPQMIRCCWCWRIKTLSWIVWQRSFKHYSHSQQLQLIKVLECNKLFNFILKVLYYACTKSWSRLCDRKIGIHFSWIQSDCSREKMNKGFSSHRIFVGRIGREANTQFGNKGGRLQSWCLSTHLIWFFLCEQLV